MPWHLNNLPDIFPYIPAATAMWSDAAALNGIVSAKTYQNLVENEMKLKSYIQAYHLNISWAAHM